MPPKLKLFALSGIAVIVVAAYFTVTGSTATRPSYAHDNTSLDQRIDALIDAQQAQSDRLDRLELLLAGGSSRPGNRGTATASITSRPNQSRDEHENEATPEQRAEQRQTRMRKLESEFMAEPVSGSWASGTEDLIESALEADSLAKKDAPVPSKQQASCRSFTCRIDTTYADGRQADIGQQFLLGDIATRLPKARMVRIEQPDGSVRLVVYANTGRARR